jgi:hypothetical protein
MLRTDWNALKTGDHVLVHDLEHPEGELVPGVVRLVERAGGSNDVAIALGRAHDQRIVHPRRLAVHHDPIEGDHRCWRCDRPRRN